MSESESVEIVQAEPVTTTAVEEGVYKNYRYRITDLYERYTKDKATALELVERWERGVNEALQVVAPSAKAIRLGFITAAQKFLEDLEN